MCHVWYRDMNVQELVTGYKWVITGKSSVRICLGMDYNNETGNLTLWLLNFTWESFQVPAATAFILFPSICLHQQWWKNNFWDGKQPQEELNTPTNQMTERWLADSIHRLMWDLNHDIGRVHIPHINPSAWSNEHCSFTRNFTCRGATSAARLLHCLTHSTISRQHREKM